MAKILRAWLTLRLMPLLTYGPGMRRVKTEQVDILSKASRLLVERLEFEVKVAQTRMR